MTNTLELDWIKIINPDWEACLSMGEEIMWNTLWNFDGTEYNEETAKITRDCRMIPVNVDGLLYCALGACGMDMTALVIYAKYKLVGWIENDDKAYLKRQSRYYVTYVVGEEKAGELYKLLD